MEYNSNTFVRFEQLRKEKGLTIAELSSRIGISGSAISNYERGLRNPDADMLLKYANFFECTTDFILGLDNNKNKSAYASTNEILLGLERLLGETGDTANILRNIVSILEMPLRSNQAPEVNINTATLRNCFYHVLSHMTSALSKTTDLVDTSGKIDTRYFLEYLSELEKCKAKANNSLSGYFWFLLCDAGTAGTQDIENPSRVNIASLWEFYGRNFDLERIKKELTSNS
jgi:transcriptional regulator with XRE-family HTH domain